MTPLTVAATAFCQRRRWRYGRVSKEKSFKNGEPLRVVMQLVDFRDLDTGYTAMQRTVAFPMSIGTQMILNGTVTKKGIINPSDVPYELPKEELHRRGLVITQKTEKWDGNEELGLR
jgi:saccharopine dehydrogenase-like NADP-dependent oxidoreductase